MCLTRSVASRRALILLRENSKDREKKRKGVAEKSKWGSKKNEWFLGGVKMLKLSVVERLSKFSQKKKKRNLPPLVLKYQ